MEITVKLNRTGALKRVGARLPRAASLMVRRMAEGYTDAVHTWIDQGRAFTPRTGQLQQGIGWMPTGAQSARVFSQAAHAGFVEHGTRPHVIRPRAGRQALRFFIGGAAIIRQSVNHPGTPALPYFFADLSARRALMLREARRAFLEVAAA